MCLDTSTNNLFIFGEIANDSAQAYDIIEWSLHVYDNLGEVPVGTTYFDIPTYSYIYPNSVIPFSVSAQVSTSVVRDYDLHLDYTPGVHIARTDLRIDEFSAVPDNRLIRVSGIWSHTNAGSIPTFVSIIGSIYDAQGRLINMHYLPMSYITVDPRLPDGQHRFSWLYLENNPCGEGTLRVSIIWGITPRSKQGPIRSG